MVLFPTRSAPAPATDATSFARWRQTWWFFAPSLVAIPFLLGALQVQFFTGLHFGAPADWFVSVVLSQAFVLALAAELLYVGFHISRDQYWQYRALLVAPGALVLFAAISWGSGSVATVVALAGSAFLIGWFLVLLQFVYRNKQLARNRMHFLVEASVGALLASAGWFVWALDHNAVVLVVSVLAAPVVLARAVGAQPTTEGNTERVPWLLHPFWVFELLVFVFVSLFFVGALLDYEIAGPRFLQFIPFVPMTGSTGFVIANSLYDGLWFAAAIMASAWFLVAIGITMGGLVVLRMREVHVPAQRYRMALMLAVFGLAAVFLPSLASSTPLVTNQYLASLPVVGWGFGLRDGGPFESGAFLAIIIMYASVGVLTVLFGRKALCSVMCGAALMYQGTTVNDMRGYHQSSRAGKYFLGSQLSMAYMVASSIALVSLFGITFLAYLHLLPLVQVANGQYDTAALPLPIELYFGAVWFAMFVLTPYLGTYNCASTGFCHWGALSIPFAKVSLFRLKVKDRKVCQACTTFDCAKACPVGLVDMPLHFRTKGEFRSTKCCGVGDCVGACPYGNLYHQDVRFWVIRALKRTSRPPMGQPLPMVTSKRPAVASPVPEAEGATPQPN